MFITFYLHFIPFSTPIKTSEEVTPSPCNVSVRIANGSSKFKTGTIIEMSSSFMAIGSFVLFASGASSLAFCRMVFIPFT